MNSYRFDLSNFTNLRDASGKRISSVELRELDGKDEQIAANRAKAKGDSTVVDELVRLSISRVNDEVVTQPFEAMDTWNMRTRTFVTGCYNAVNGITEEESKDFLALARAAVPSETA